MSEATIIDMYCGSRMFLFDKQYERTVLYNRGVVSCGNHRNELIA